MVYIFHLYEFSYFGTFSNTFCLSIYYKPDLCNLRMIKNLVYLLQDIADAAYVKSRGRPTPINLSVLVADLLFSVLLQAFFLIQVNLDQQEVKIIESNLSEQTTNQQPIHNH